MQKETKSGFERSLEGEQPWPPKMFKIGVSEFITKPEVVQEVKVTVTKAAPPKEY